MSRVIVAVAIAVVAAGIALLLNVTLLTHAEPNHDPVGHLSPSSALVRPGPASSQPRPASTGELPDD